MSQITNNLIVLSVDHDDQFLRSFESLKSEFCLGHLLEEHRRDGIVAYSFDCIGDNPWYIYPHKHGYFKVNIIDYLDDDWIIVTKCDDDGNIKEVGDCWQDVLEDYLPKEVINSLEDYFSA